MQYRSFGKTNWQVSEIGFGAWAIGDAWGELVPEEQAGTALHHALDQGVNFIDTADVYGAGRSESIIGSVLVERENKNEIYVATKMGRSEGWSDDYDSVARAAEAAIKRLGVEQLDLVQLHCIPTDTLKASKAFTSLEKTKEAGLIQHYGVSIETIEEGLFCIKESEAVSLQVIFNIFRQRVSDELLPAAQESNTAIIARVPLASGLLTGKFSDNHQFHPEDHRHFNANGELFNVGETFAGVPFATGVEHAQKIEALLLPEDSDKPLAQKALRWILDHEAISTVIPGAKNSTQVDDHLAASAMAPLSDQAHQNLSELYASNIDSSVRGAY